MIPHIAHYIWLNPDDNDNPIPDDLLYYQKKFKQLHLDWRIYNWNDSNIPIECLINKTIYQESTGVVLKKDLLFFELLYKYGGVALDFDMEFYKTITPYLEGIDCFSCGERPGIVGNAVMGAIPQHPTIKKLIDHLPQSIRENKDYGVNIKSGPVYCTKTLERDDIHLFPTKCFFPVFADSPPDREEDYPDSIANHHFKGSWIGYEDTLNWNEWLKDNPDWYEKYRL